MKKLVLLPVVVAALSSCSGQVKEVSCAVDDWDKAGHKVATQGESVRTFNEYQNQCGSSVGEPEKQAFLDGFTRGIIEYCTFDNGHELGSKSLPLTKTCPPELVGIFEKGYKIGALEHKDKMHNLQKYSDLNQQQGDLTESAQVQNRQPPAN